MDRQVEIKRVDFRMANTQRGPSPVADVHVKSLDNGEELKVAIWGLTQDKWTYMNGEKVTMTLNEKKNGQYVNYSTKLDSITPIPTKTWEAPKNGVPAEVWAEKDVRMARMNALSHAVEIVTAEFPKPQGEDTRTEMVIKVATRLVKFIYGDEEKKETVEEPF